MELFKATIFIDDRNGNLEESLKNCGFSSITKGSSSFEECIEFVGDMNDIEVWAESRGIDDERIIYQKVEEQSK